jgi:hypothetical protein
MNATPIWPTRRTNGKDPGRTPNKQDRAKTENGQVTSNY